MQNFSTGQFQKESAVKKIKHSRKSDANTPDSLRLALSLSHLITVHKETLN